MMVHPPTAWSSNSFSSMASLVWEPGPTTTKHFKGNGRTVNPLWSRVPVGHRRAFSKGSFYAACIHSRELSPEIPGTPFVFNFQLLPVLVWLGYKENSSSKLSKPKLEDSTWNSRGKQIIPGNIIIIIIKTENVSDKSTARIVTHTAPDSPGPVPSCCSLKPCFFFFLLVLAKCTEEE